MTPVNLYTRLKFRWDASQDRDSSGTLSDPMAHLLRLIEQISSGLRERQFIVGRPMADGTPGWVRNSWAYDCCYTVPIEYQNNNFSIQVGYFDEHDDGFYCFIEPHSPTIWRLFWRVNMQVEFVPKLQESIDQILKSDKQANSLKWSTFDDYDMKDL
jgi:hypothetical protein